MLVLTRKLNEQIRIGDDVTITVIRVKGNTIRLGIEAPRSTRVVRGELEPLDQEPERASVPTVTQPQPAAVKRAASGQTWAATGKQTASPLAAYMSPKPACVMAELSV